MGDQPKANDGLAVTMSPDLPSTPPAVVVVVVAISIPVISIRNYYRDSGFHIAVAITVVDRHNHAATQARERERCNEDKQNSFHVNLQQNDIP